MQTFEEFAQSAGAMAVLASQFLSDHSAELLGPDATSSQSADIVVRITKLLPGLAAAVMTRASELAAAAAASEPGAGVLTIPSLPGMIALVDGPNNGHQVPEDPEWVIGTPMIVGEPAHPYRRMAENFAIYAAELAEPTEPEPEA